MLDRYDFGSTPVILGQSATATVYKVTDQQLRRTVALKVFTREDALSNDELKSLARIGKVSGPNVIGTIHHGRINVRGDSRLLHFVAMEYRDGSTLAADALADVSWDTVAPEDARRHCEDALLLIRHSFAGLQQLHEAHVSHGGIKPSNILVTRDADGRVSGAKLVDAGHATIVRTADHRARALYRAPEQFAGEPAAEAADVFSLGVVAYELLTRWHPFLGPLGQAEIAALGRSIETVTPVSISELNLHVPESVALILHRTLARQPGDRPSPAEVVQLLESVSVHAQAWLSISAEVAQARELYQRGELERASKALAALEHKGWVLPQVHGLRARASAEVALRKSVLERQAEDVALAEEALSSGYPRQAWYQLELLHARQECDPYEQDAHHGELARLRTELRDLCEAEENWLARVRDLIRAGSLDEAIAQCVQIGSTVRPTRAVRALELEARAQRYRPLIGDIERRLNAASEEERAKHREAIAETIDNAPNVLTECFQLLEARRALIDELRFEAAMHHDAADAVAELDVIEMLLEIAPDEALVKQQRALELAVERQLADQRQAIWLDTLEQLVETGDWERVRALMQAARAQLERNAQRAESAEQSASLAEAESEVPAAETLSAPVIEPELVPPADIPSAAQEAAPDVIELPRATERAPTKSRPAAELPEARPRTIIGMSAAAVVLLLLAAVTMPGRKVSVAFDHVPQGATLVVDGQPVSDTSVMLGPGVHRWSITAADYEPDSGSFQVERNAVRVPLELSPRRKTQPIAKPPTPLPPAYGSVLVVTPGQNDVAVLVDRKPVGQTAGTSLRIDSLAPGAHTISVEKEGFCLKDARPRRISITAAEQRTDTFRLQRWPRLLVNSNVRNAQFRVEAERSGPHRAGEVVSLEPGTHRYTVTAVQHHDSTATVALECGKNRSISVSLRPDPGARTTPGPAVAKPVAIAGWARDCFQRQDGWLEAARDCFHNEGSTVRKYQFEVRRVSSGNAVYGPWLVGTRGAFVECKIEGGEFRWRVAGRGNWQSAALQLPRNAPRLFVRVSAGSDAATLEIGADATLKNAQRLRVRAGGGFGVKKDAQIREFRRG